MPESDLINPSLQGGGSRRKDFLPTLSRVFATVQARGTETLKRVVFLSGCVSPLPERLRQTVLLSPALSSLGGGEGEERADRFMVPMRAENGVGAAHEPPFQRGRQRNRLTPHPGPLPFEGRGRIGSPVH